MEGADAVADRVPARRRRRRGGEQPAASFQPGGRRRGARRSSRRAAPSAASLAPDPRWLVYVLTQRVPAQRRAARLYIGATVCMARRLRQHNRDLAGGARITSRAVAAGAVWRVAATVEGFACKHDALSFEGSVKLLKRHRTRRSDAPLTRALAAAAILAERPRWGGALRIRVR